jgi:hypothetical protein
VTTSARSSRPTATTPTRTSAWPAGTAATWYVHLIVFLGVDRSPCSCLRGGSDGFWGGWAAGRCAATVAPPCITCSASARRRSRWRTACGPAPSTSASPATRRATPSVRPLRSPVDLLSHLPALVVLPGGLLFRCLVCPGSWCEDDLPPEAQLVGPNVRFEKLGFPQPKQACFVLCESFTFAQQGAGERCLTLCGRGVALSRLGGVRGL